MARHASTAAQIAAANLRVDAATAEVLREFEAGGVRSLLIKGIATNRWLATPERPRMYGDCDLLVPPDDLEGAERVLAGLGLHPVLDERQMPDWWREHATTWSRQEPDAFGATVDLHRTLPGVGVDPAKLWEVLSAHSETLVVGGYQARVLTLPGRAFNLALHAAQHGPEWDRVQTDLERAISYGDERIWGAAAELATAVDATAAFAAGLRLSTAGNALADRLSLPTDVSVDVAIRARTAPPVALGLDQLARAKGIGGRLSILRYKLVPPPAFMKHWSPLARQGRLGLALAYLWRPLWLLIRLPAGFRAWWRARRSRAGSA